MLPGIDGLEVCREIRRVDRTPIVMLTARRTPSMWWSASSWAPTITFPSRSSQPSWWLGAGVLRRGRATVRGGASCG